MPNWCNNSIHIKGPKAKIEALYQEIKGKGKMLDVICPMPEELKDQYQYFTEANLSKLRSNLGYNKDFYSIEDAVQDYVSNYLSSSDPYL